MSSSGNVILLESLDGSSHKLAERLHAFGTEPVLVSNFEEAQTILEARRLLIAAVLIPTEVPSQSLKRSLKILKNMGPASGLIFVSIGKPPTDDERKKLRSAGMQLAVWEPYDDGMLRFQLNRALCGDRDHHGRKHRRAPTYLLARVFVGDRTKDAVVYSLSTGGAFLETPRASMEDAPLEIELRLPGNFIRIGGRVIFSNVPGNLQRPNLPMGMGIRFERGDRKDLDAIEAYVKSRLEELQV